MLIRQRRTLRLLAAMLVLALVAAACGDDEADDSEVSTVLGGRQAIVTSHHSEVSQPMFEDPPACYLFRQASFAFSFFPDEVQQDLDNRAGWFPFPEIDEEHGTPALIAGDLAVMFTDNPMAEDLMQFLASAEGLEGWASFGGVLSPHLDFDTSLYASDLDRSQQEFLADASYARFDASDLMPAAVGAGSFWTEMTSWINGDVELDTALQNIEDSWPAEGEAAEEGDEDAEVGDPPAGGDVNIMTPWTGDDESGFLAAIEPWVEANDVNVSHEGSGDFETLINTRVEGGNPPDIALIPQPGLMADLHRSSGLRDLSQVLDAGEFQNSVVDGLYELGEVDGTFVGATFKISLKSMVWYPRQEFEDAGYEVPETWDELVALTEQIRDDGASPWCVGIESGGATGWTATDWIEDIMLRTAGADAYDDWVTNDLPFTSDEVTRAAELFEELLLDD